MPLPLINAPTLWRSPPGNYTENDRLRLPEEQLPVVHEHSARKVLQHVNYIKLKPEVVQARSKNIVGISNSPNRCLMLLDETEAKKPEYASSIRQTMQFFIGLRAPGQDTPLTYSELLNMAEQESPPSYYHLPPSKRF